MQLKKNWSILTFFTSSPNVFSRAFTVGLVQSRDTHAPVQTGVNVTRGPIILHYVDTGRGRGDQVVVQMSINVNLLMSNVKCISSQHHLLYSFFSYYVDKSFHITCTCITYYIPCYSSESLNFSCVVPVFEYLSICNTMLDMLVCNKKSLPTNYCL